MHLASILIVRDIAYTEEKIIAWQKCKKQMNLQSTQIKNILFLNFLNKISKRCILRGIYIQHGILKSSVWQFVPLVLSMSPDTCRVYRARVTTDRGEELFALVNTSDAVSIYEPQ